MIGIFSDVHANPFALSAVLEDMQRKGAEELYFLGDVLTGPDPAATIEILYGSGCTPIAGNVEKWVIDGDIDIPYTDQLRIDVSAKMRRIREHISPVHLSWVMDWPEDYRMNEMYFVHDSPFDRIHERSLRERSLDEVYLYHAKGLYVDSPDSEYEKNAQICRENGHDIVFFGHTHNPWQAESRGVMLCCVGSVGFCFGDDQRPSWVSWDGEVAEVHRVTYDIDATIEIVKTGEHQIEDRDAYIFMLQTGKFWRDFRKKEGK